MKLKPIKIFLLLWCGLVPPVSMADDDAEPAEANLKLTPELQAKAGLETVTLSSARHQTEFVSSGKAINLQPLLTLRNRYLINLTEQRSAKARLNQSVQNTRRLEDLYRSGITAQRNLQAQQAQLQTEQAQLDAGLIQNQTLIDEARFTWGDTLADWAFKSDNARLKALLSGRQTLLLINVPIGKLAVNQRRTIYIDTAGNRSNAQPAQWVSTAPQPDTNQQAEYYFYQTVGERIRPGMRVTAWLPENQQHAGVIIPETALIWHLNQAWVYVKTDASHFTRQLVTDFSLTGQGYFVNQGLAAGQEIVSKGAQLLLSEEIRGQIPDD